MQALRLFSIVQEQAIFSDARHAKIRADAADSQDECVVRQSAAWRDGFSNVISDGVECDSLFFSVHPGEVSEPEFVVIPHRVRQKTDLIISDAARACRKFMQ